MAGVPPLSGEQLLEVQGVDDPRLFFRHLHLIFPFGMTLLIEGLDLGLTSKSWYEEHPATYRAKVACDMLDPAPEFYHVEFSADFAEGLCQIIESQGLEAAFYHLKGYSQSEIIFVFHDAFTGELAVSKSVEEKAVREFALALGGEVEPAVAVDQLKELRTVDRHFNPPWWKSGWNYFRDLLRR